MKICKHCQVENADNAQFCDACGAELKDAPVDTTVEMATAIFDTDAPAAAAQPKKKKAPAGLIVGVIIAALLIVAVIVGKGRYDRQQADGAPVGDTPVSDAPVSDTPAGDAPVSDAADSGSLAGHHINAYGFVSHSVHYVNNGDGTYLYDYLDKDGNPVSVEQSDLDALLDQEVASAGDQILTNRQLMFYFDEQYYSFTQTYGAYLSFMMDSTKGLDEQQSPEEGKTWQQFFLDATIDTFHKVAAISTYAEGHGFPITQQMRDQVQSVAESIEEMAVAYGFGSGDDYLKGTFGPGATMDAYLDFCLLSSHVNNYFSHLQSITSFTSEELDAYYDENAQMLQTNYGLEKIDKNVISVRHILIQPETVTDESGNAAPTEETWAAAEAEAQRIYDEWLAGEATEATFAELAATYTQDAGSQSTGGQYNDVYPGQMVPAFNDWCFADGRQSGDHDIVKTDFGYHIMYFCSEGSYVYWQMAVESLLFDQWLSDEIANMQAVYPLTADISKAVLLDLTAPTVPAPAAETESDAAAAE